MQFSGIQIDPNFLNLELLARQVVEGFITGMHKSPFHGFSVEFAEHRLYNKGESTRHIDWKLYARTEKLFTKRYEEETNLRCHVIIDNSASMYFPESDNSRPEALNKMGFSVIATAVLLEMLKRQRDAFGLGIYSDTIDYYTPAKGSERHKRMLMHRLERLLKEKTSRKTDTYRVLHQIAEKIHRRSLIFLFSDMLQPDRENNALFEALRHLKYNKHDVVLFHTYDAKLEWHFDYDNRPRRFVDVETGAHIDLFSNAVKKAYEEKVGTYFKALKLKCMQYKIDYVPVDIRQDFNQVLTAYFLSRRKFL